MARNDHKPKTVRKGRYGMNADTLASMKQSEAVKFYGKVPAHLVKEAHAEAVQMKKDEATPAAEAEG